MPRDSRLYLDDILGAVEKVSEYVRGMDYEAFAGDLSVVGKKRHYEIKYLNQWTQRLRFSRKASSKL
jgi:uncharacterized protein with HEPN domain